MYIKSIWDRMIGCEKNCSYVPNNLNILYPVHMQISLILRKQLSFQFIDRMYSFVAFVVFL